MKSGLCFLCLVLAGSLPAAEVVITTNSAHTNKPPAAVTPLESNAYKGFRLQKGFRLELVAAEPLVVNPGAMAFDENNRLFVLETPDGQPGRVRLLDDLDDDGIFDSSRAYAENVTAPTALACYGGGVFVGSGTEIIYLKDTKNDGVADARRVVFSGFGDATNGANGRIIYTAMSWGLDNWIHVATASRSGDIISSSLPKQSVVLPSGSFAFDPRTFVLGGESGSAPGGMAFDNRGRKFVADAFGHVQTVMTEPRYAMRNPFFPMPEVGANFSSGPANLIYPAFPGQMGKPAPITMAGGLLLYRGYQLPSDYQENTFMADSAASVVHREKFDGNAVEPIPRRPIEDANSEFLAVTDGSFLPTQFANAPDGTLYISGFARQPITSRASSGTNNNFKGEGMGRIYRVVPVTFKQPKLPKFAKAATTNLVDALRHSNGWHRDTAARLIYERQDKAAVVPLIQLLFDPRSPALGRMHALHALAGMQALIPGHLIRGYNDADDRVREHAILLSEKLSQASGASLPESLWSQFGRLTADSSPQVRYQLAMTIGQFPNAGRAQLLADIIRNDPTNRWMQAAVLSSVGERTAELFAALAADGNVRIMAPDFLTRLVTTIGAKNQPEEVSQTLANIVAISDSSLAFQLVRGLGEGLQSVNGSLTAADTQRVLPPLYNRATRVALGASASEAARVQALRMLSVGNYVTPAAVDTILLSWAAYPSRVREEAIEMAFSHPLRTSVFLTEMERGIIVLPELSSIQIRFLLSNPDASIRQRALVFYAGYQSGSRQNVVNNFMSSLEMNGTATHGRFLYNLRCAACHQFGGEGNPLGSAFAPGIAKETLLTKILDPNRVQSPGPATVVTTREGETLLGFVSAQNPRSLTVCQANGNARVIGRQNIQAQTALGISGMPERLEAGWNQQDLADLLEFLSPTAH